jgi:hypothetical protein
VTEESGEKFIEESIEQVDLDFRAAKHDVEFLQVCSFEINGLLRHLFYDGEPTRGRGN